MTSAQDILNYDESTQWDVSVKYNFPNCLALMVKWNYVLRFFIHERTQTHRKDIAES